MSSLPLFVCAATPQRNLCGLVFFLYNLSLLIKAGSNIAIMVHPKGKAEARKRFFATRFTTEMCRTFQEQGSCPYTFKCMFAHGHDDLRTEAMNEREGLTSANAVRRWLLSTHTDAEETGAVWCEKAHGSSDGSEHAMVKQDSGSSSLNKSRPWRHDPYSWVPFVHCTPAHTESG